MRVKSVSFKNYKAFYEEQTMKIKPITILIGKNSSGKSSIAKLFTLFETSLMGNIDVLLLLNNNGVDLGGEFDNLFFENNPGGISLIFKIVFENDVQIEIGLLKKNDGYGLDIVLWNYKDQTQEFELQLKDSGYLDAISNKIYECEFKGFIPSKFTEKDTNQDLSRNFQIEQIYVDYIGPFRKLPTRDFYLKGETKFRYTGIDGTNAYAMLGISKLKKDDELYKNVGNWYKQYFGGWELKVDDRDRKPAIQILLSKNDIDVNLVDVGQGMSQALPLVVRANLTDRPDSIIVLEQPELHLHPAAHGDLAELFAKSAKQNNQTFIIETHIVEYDNSGGVGEVAKVAQDRIKMSRYRNLFQYKLMAIFDSDKCSSTGFITRHKDKIEYFKSKSIQTLQPDDYEYNESTDVIIWHILYKRKIENYIPLNLLFTTIASITEE